MVQQGFPYGAVFSKSWEGGGLVPRTTLYFREMRPDWILNSLLYQTKDSGFFNAEGSRQTLKTFKWSSDNLITVRSVKNQLKLGKARSREGS